MFLGEGWARERKGGMGRERETDRQTDRQRHREGWGETDTDRRTETQRGGRDRQADRQTDRQRHTEKMRKIHFYLGEGLHEDQLDQVRQQ